MNSTQSSLICQQRMTLKYILSDQLHIKSTERKKEIHLNCNLCGMAFKTKQTLNNHTITHTGEKPNKCLYCNAQFIAKSDINRHIRLVHSGLPTSCFQRGKSFKYLNKHIISVHRSKSIRCTYCDRQFKTSRTMKQHRKREHELLPRHCYQCNKTVKDLKGIQCHFTLLRHKSVHFVTRPLVQQIG